MVAVLAVYGAWFAIRYPSSHSARDFIFIGSKFLTRSHASAAIRVDPAYARTLGVVGYDGQFCYFIALDPLHARPYIDSPSYRYTRILYPLLARALAFGQTHLIPYTLFAINWVSAGVATFLLALWLARRGSSPWYAALFGLFPGTFAALSRDLTEPLGYCLVAGALYLFVYGGRHREWYAAAAFALAALTREVTALFAVVYGLSLLWEHGHLQWRAGWPRALRFLSLSLLPLLVYKGLLALWLGSLGLRPNVSPIRAPLSGIFFYWPWDGDHWTLVVCLVVPALLWGALVLWAGVRNGWTVELAAFLVNMLIFDVFLSPSSFSEYEAAGRINMGAVLAAILCLPLCTRLCGRARLVLVLAASLWLWPALHLYLLGMVHAAVRAMF
jgi:hypothetical protein